MKLRYSIWAACACLPLFFAASAQAITITSSTHPAFVSKDFEDGKTAFAPYQKEGGVASGARFKIDDGGLLISNAFAGSFGINTQLAGFDAEKFPVLSFDYVLTPSVKVNIFFRYNGSYHGVVFTGPKDVRAGSVLLGQVKNVTVDGKWHRAEIPLRDWLRKLYPTKSQLVIDEVIIGNWDNSNYLMAGIGGNGPGAWWKMDNFSVMGVGAGEAKFTVSGDNNMTLANPQDYSWSIDGGDETPLKTSDITTPVADGFHRLRITKAKKLAGEYDFVASTSSPRVGKPEIRENLLVVPIDTGAGLTWTNLKLTVGDRAFQLDSPYLIWDGASSQLVLQAADAGFQWKDGQDVKVNLEGVQDLMGRTATVPSATVKVNYAEHKTAPPEPQLVALQSMGSGTFESGMDEWGARTELEGPAIVVRDSENPAHGKYSLRITCSANASNFGATIRRTPFDAARFPVIEFDYKVPPELRVDFLFEWAGQTFSVGFTDRTPQWTRLGSLQSVIADNQWHHSQLRLYEMMRSYRPGAADYKISWLALADSGWLGNARGSKYWIDNFQFTPVVKGAPFESTVIAPDVTGIKGVSWVIDGKDSTEAPATARDDSTIRQNESGAKWLHARVQDGAGGWSSTSHTPVLLDIAPPQVGAIIPADGTKSGASRMDLQITDDTGLDFSNVNLNLLGRDYNMRDAALRYDNEKLTLDLDRALVDGQLAPLKDATALQWKLTGVRDVAGQSVPDVQGTWTYDYAQDKIGPGSQLSSTTHVAAWRDDFDTEAPANPMVQPVMRMGNMMRRMAPGTWTSENLRLERGKRDPSDPANLSMRAVVVAANTAFTARLSRSWDISRFPMLGFAYKVPAGQELFIRLRVGGNNIWNIKFLGAAPANIAGEIPGAVADNNWHWAQINLGALRDKLGNTQIQMVEFVDQTGRWPAESAFELDDFTVQQAPAGNIRLTWKASDLSGVQAYRFAWDQVPTTLPTEVVTGTSKEIPPPATGTYWAHLQAQDNAGNWGPAEHLPVMIP